jgi:hypothetical protein
MNEAQAEPFRDALLRLISVGRQAPIDTDDRTLADYLSACLSAYDSMMGLENRSETLINDLKRAAEFSKIQLDPESSML